MTTKKAKLVARTASALTAGGIAESASPASAREAAAGATRVTTGGSVKRCPYGALPIVVLDPVVRRLAVYGCRTSGRIGSASDPGLRVWGNRAAHC
ncbi:hypothetical protein [Streptomyces sp. NBC_00316]|uniref:hypothetical protein n=1 Tax=Streptomyces sp. NBC_00316 TaxID=2975710 RepID=UPI002E2B33A7|nr:hypothetical protein [Streptomyces sp. NBC_00316]